MKSETETSVDADEMLPEYDFGKSVRNRFADRFKDMEVSQFVKTVQNGVVVFAPADSGNSVMKPELAKRLEELKILAGQVRHAREQVEGKVDEFNKIIRDYGDLGIIPRKSFLGKTTSQPYDSEAGCTDSGSVVRTALLIPDGFGVCHFDTEVHSALDPEELEKEARRQFEPFANCEPAEQAFLYSDIDALFQQFADYCSTWSLSP